MVEILANDENTINVELEALPVSFVSAPYEPYVAPYKTPTSNPLISGNVTPTIPKIAYTLGKTVLSLDAETTGINPWEYKLIVNSVWDLNEPKGNMKTFSGWDEEELCKELFAYIESKKPDVILAFNAKFEQRCYTTRAMLYHIQAPWIWSCEWHDMMTMLEGGWKNGLSGTMPAGSEENWLQFFFGESKPYNIDECFEGVRNGSLREFEIRNRTCVQGQGDMYRLLMYCQASEEGKVAEVKPSTARIDELSEAGTILEKCQVCEAVNEVTDPSNPGQCWRCLAALPKPASNNIIKEVVRQIDWSQVGLTAAQIKAAAAPAPTAKKAYTAISAVK